MHKLKKVLPWLIVALIVAIADQWSKYLIVSHFSLSDSIAVIPNYFNLVLTYNEGAAFGFLSSAGGWQRYLFGIFAIGISAWLITMIYRSLNRPLLCFSLALILGGAVGNLIDRFRIGAVVDFIDWHVGAAHWPAFNIADVGICVGVVLLLIDSFYLLKRPKRAAQPS